MKYIFCDLETARLPNEIKPEEGINDVCLQLAYIILDDDVGFDKPIMIKDVLTNPGCTISYTTMTAHNITNDMVIGRPNVKDTEEYNYLKNIIQSGEYTFVAHNAKFDIWVLNMIGIDIMKYCNVIDTLRISEVINDQIGLKLEMNKLRYIVYFYGLEKKKPKLAKLYGLSDKDTYHEAMSDILDLILIYLHFKSDFKASYDDMVYLSNNAVKLDYVPFGSNRGKKFDELTFNSLKWYLTTDNPNVVYTAGLYL